MYNVKTNKDGSEIIRYNNPLFFAYAGSGYLSECLNYRVDAHYHGDIEFIAVLSGEMDYSINGKIITIKEGDGIIINSNRIHYGFSDNQRECFYACVILHPLLLCSSEYIEKKYVLPIISDNSPDFFYLSASTKYGSLIIKKIIEAEKIITKNTSPLAVQSAFFEIWNSLYENFSFSETDKRGDIKLSVLKKMIAFIHDNYKNKISLSDIASVGNVCKSSCSELFKRYLNSSPVSYLIDYRLKKAIELLETENLSVTEAAYEVGFMGTSYFTEAFRSHYGMPPTAYLKGKKPDSGINTDNLP